MKRALFVIIIGLTGISAYAAILKGPAKPTPPKPYLMAALGDSITAGFLANTNLMGASAIALYAASSTEEIRYQIEARSLFENKKNYSWASGIKIPSHFH